MAANWHRIAHSVSFFFSTFSYCTKNVSFSILAEIGFFSVEINNIISLEENDVNSFFFDEFKSTF
jgi:hypothetical protein